MVHLIQSSPRVYGAERCILLELVSLRQRGHDARALILSEARMGPDAAVLPRAFESAGIPVEQVQTLGRVSLGLLRDLSRTLRRLRPDVVQSHSLKTDVLGFLVTRPLSLPFLVELHGWLRPKNDRLVRAYEALDRAVLRRCEGVLVLSTAYQDELRGLGVPAQRTHLLPSGIDVECLRRTPRRRDLRAELGIPPQTPVVGIVARLSPEKGHRDFLHALHVARSALPGETAPVGLVIGDGPLLPELQEEGRRLGLGDALHFTGYVPEVADAYRALSVLVSCSLYEGLPLNLIEAMALSLPVLAMATGGCADIVVPERTGLLVPRGDREALSLALTRLCGDPALRERLGAAGLSRACEHYSLSAWAQGAEAVYQRLAEPGRGPRRPRWRLDRKPRG